MSSLPTPNTLPVDSEVHRLAVFTARQLANKTKAINAAIEYALVLSASLENPFEDLIPQVHDSTLGTKLQALSRSAEIANSALVRMVSATEQGADQLTEFCTDYTDAVKLLDDYGYVYSPCDLFPRLRVFPTEIKTLLTFNVRELKQREALLPLRFHGEDLSFEKALHTGRALREEPSAKSGLVEGNQLKVAAKTTTGQPSWDQLPRPTAPLPVVVHTIEPAVKTAVKATINPAQHKMPPPSNPFVIEQLQADARKTGDATPATQVKAAGPQIDSVPSSTVAIEVLRVDAQKTGPAAPTATSATHVKDAVSRIESACSYFQAPRPCLKMAARDRTTSRAMKRRALDQEDLLRYRQEKTVAGTTTTSTATVAAALAGPSRQPAAAQDCAPATPSRQIRTPGPVKSLNVKMPTTTKPKVRQEKRKLARFEIFQDSQSACDSPGASPCDMRAGQGKEKKRRISGPATPPLALRSGDKENVPSIKANTENKGRKVVHWSVRTPPLTPPRRAYTSRRPAQPVAAVAVTVPPQVQPTIVLVAATPTQYAAISVAPMAPPSRVRPRMSDMAITDAEFQAVLQEIFF
ncbi:hypothetical protein CF328_g7856 [Tilletia controversa]|nr:hypothetical protein CF328_g7856 [Tilletia controversa]